MWPGPSDHHLHVVFPGLFGELAQGFQLGELGLVAGVGDAAGTQSVPQRKGDVVLPEDLADVFEALVEHVLPVVLHHPLGQDGAAAADDAVMRRVVERDMLDQHAGVDGHVVHALLALLLDDVQHDARAQVLHAPHAARALRKWARCRWAPAKRRGGLCGWPGCRRRWRGPSRIGAVLDGVAQLFQFLFDVGQDGGIPDIGIDLAGGGDADATSARGLGGLRWPGMIIGRGPLRRRTKSEADFPAGDVVHLSVTVPWRA